MEFQLFKTCVMLALSIICMFVLTIVFIEKMRDWKIVTRVNNGVIRRLSNEGVREFELNVYKKLDIEMSDTHMYHVELYYRDSKDLVQFESWDINGKRPGVITEETQRSHIHYTLANV